MGSISADTFDDDQVNVLGDWVDQHLQPWPYCIHG